MGLESSPPSLEEARSAIASYAVDVASRVLSERGFTYRQASTAAEAAKVHDRQVRRYLAEQDLLGAAAALLQCLSALDAPARESVQGLVDALTEGLWKAGDRHFWDDGESQSALRCYQLASGLDPNRGEALKGVLSVCLHGHPIRAELALPFAVVFEHVDPTRRSQVPYIQKLIQEGTTDLTEGLAMPMEQLRPFLTATMNPTAEDVSSLEYWDMLIRRMPDAKSYVGRATVLLNEGRDQEALADFGKALELDPDYRPALLGRGHFLGSAGDYERAVVDLTRVIDLPEPEGSEEIEILVESYRTRAKCHAQLGRHEAAVADLDRVIARGSGEAEDYGFRGSLLASLERYEEATASLREALARDPEDVAAHAVLGRVFLNRSRQEEALEHLDLAADSGDRRSAELAAQIRFDLALTPLLRATTFEDFREVSTRFPVLGTDEFGDWAGRVADAQDKEESRRLIRRRAATLRGVLDELVEAPVADWPTGGGGNRRVGLSLSSLTPPLEVTWELDTGARVIGGIAVSDGVAVIGDVEGHVSAVDVDEGSVRWRREVGRVYGTPAISGERLFVGAAGRGICLDIATGEVVWRDAMDADDASGGEARRRVLQLGCVLAAGDRVVFCDDRVRILDLSAGSLISELSKSFDSFPHAGACASGEHLYVPTPVGIRLLDSASLDEIDLFVTEGKLCSGPVLDGDLLIYTNSRAQIFALSPSFRGLLWSFRAEAEHPWAEARPAVAGDRVLFPAPDGRLYGLDAETGRVVWEGHFGHELKSPPLVSGEIAYLLTAEGLQAVSTADGQSVWSCSIEGAGSESRLTLLGPSGGTTSRVDAPGCALALAGETLLVGARKLMAFRAVRR